MDEQPLFASFRALGYITDSVPFAINRRGKETWVACSVGRSWQIFNCAKLTLVLVGPQVKLGIPLDFVLMFGVPNIGWFGSPGSVCERV
jgi:hypothetical protein